MVPFICNFRGENNKAPRFYLGALNPAERTGFEPANRFCRLHAFQACLLNPAERTGFEPANRFCRLHAFQACLFNHSSTSPFAMRMQRYE